MDRSCLVRTQDIAVQEPIRCLPYYSDPTQDFAGEDDSANTRLVFSARLPKGHSQFLFYSQTQAYMGSI